MRFAYITGDEKSIPAWHMRKLNLIFCASDLNWYDKPVKHVAAHISEPYDVLIQLNSDESIALDFLCRVKAKMKVANFSTNRPQDFDSHSATSQ